MTDDLQRWAEFLGMDEERQMAYEQGQRDAVQRIRDGVVPWLPHASDCNIRHHEGVCDCECAAVLAVIDAGTPAPHPDDHPAAGCVHCQDLAADADDLAREIDREEGR